MDAQEERLTLEQDTPRGLEPSYATFNPIEHYYGDSTRELILGGTVLMLLASPLYADRLSVEFPMEVVGAIVAVVVAALTNPRNRLFVMGDAVVSGVALVVFESWAILDFAPGNPVAFVFREAIAVIALFALYFSVKTLRAMDMHQIGRAGRGGQVVGAELQVRHRLPPPPPEDPLLRAKDLPVGEDMDGE